MVRRLLAILVVSGFVVVAPAGPAAAQSDARPTLAYAPGAAAPHGLYFLQPEGAAAADGLRRVAPGEAADFAVLSAREALERRARGDGLRVVYVLSRAAADSVVLVASEHMLSSNPLKVEGVITLFERARRWLGTHEQELAERLGAELRVPVATVQAALAGRDFQVARPGPALAQALRAGAAPAQAAAVDGLLDDRPARAALRALDAPAAPLLVSQR
ncbi:MAG: hypothetical protein JNM90_23725 [Burkholderiales bacterium]|nr:hypothetical protein [Burkholderiales bacterium]